MKLEFIVLSFAVVTALGLQFTLQEAEAQYYDTSDSYTTPEQLDECKTLGIEPERCSEEEIMKTRCLGGVGAPCGGTSRPPELDSTTLYVLFGSGIAFMLGSLTVMKIRKSSRSNQ
jgi:hypothetical protein